MRIFVHITSVLLLLLMVAFFWVTICGTGAYTSNPVVLWATSTFVIVNTWVLLGLTSQTDLQVVWPPRLRKANEISANLMLLVLLPIAAELIWPSQVHRELTAQGARNVWFVIVTEYFIVLGACMFAGGFVGWLFTREARRMAPVHGSHSCS